MVLGTIACIIGSIIIYYLITKILKNEVLLSFENSLKNKLKINKKKTQ